jgi:hypothetical protein
MGYLAGGKPYWESNNGQAIQTDLSEASEGASTAAEAKN